MNSQKFNKFMLNIFFNIKYYLKCVIENIIFKTCFFLYNIKIIFLVLLSIRNFIHRLDVNFKIYLFGLLFKVSKFLFQYKLMLGLFLKHVKRKSNLM